MFDESGRERERSRGKCVRECGAICGIEISLLDSDFGHKYKCCFSFSDKNKTNGKQLLQHGIVYVCVRVCMCLYYHAMMIWFVFNEFCITNSYHRIGNKTQKKNPKLNDIFNSWTLMPHQITAHKHSHTHTHVFIWILKFKWFY